MTNNKDKLNAVSIVNRILPSNIDVVSVLLNQGRYAEAEAKVTEIQTELRKLQKHIRNLK